MATPTLLALALALCLVASSISLAAPIRVELRQDAGQWKLLRDGKPYYIKGAVYWADPAGKFPLSGISQRGGNSIRVGGSNLRKVLDEAQRLDMTCVVGLSMAMEHVHKFDYSDEKAVAQQFDRIKKQIDDLKDHPALLMWGIGNELPLFYTNKKVWDAVQQVAAYIHETDPNHPTMTVIGDSPAYAEVLPEIARRCPAIDILGINEYGGLTAVPKRIRDAGWTRPYCITEWGPTGHWQVRKTQWGAPIEETSSEKAAVYQQRYEGTMPKDPAMCLGSYVFFWQSKQEMTHTWYGMFLESGERTESVNVMQYCWTGQWPPNRAPRIESLSIDGRLAPDSIRLKPQSRCTADLKVTDPDADPMTISWQILPEPAKFGYGGMGERKPKHLDGLIPSGPGPHMTFTAPTEKGAYRLFVEIRDGQGNAATANIPFYVEP